MAVARQAELRGLPVQPSHESCDLAFRVDSNMGTGVMVYSVRLASENVIPIYTDRILVYASRVSHDVPESKSKSESIVTFWSFMCLLLASRTSKTRSREVARPA